MLNTHCDPHVLLFRRQMIDERNRKRGKYVIMRDREIKQMIEMDGLDI